MNINEYISSGILEQYITGRTSAQETQEVECMSHIYPEIHSELLSIQNALEQLAQQEAVNPPARIKDSIFDAIDRLETEPSTQKVKDISADNSDALTFTKNNNIFRSAAAILFLISAGLGYLLFSAKRDVSNFSDDLANVKKEIENKESVLQNKKSEIAILKDKAFQMITMNGIPAKDSSYQANIYFNKSNQEVYVTLANLPKPAAGKQYQLWAIADGKPVDLGMVALENTDSILQKMKSIRNPQAFAITLEKEGGVPSPTMDEMYVMGGV
jgi:anti-sigma-K factor RskA